MSRNSQGDTISNAQIFEGVYLNGQSNERRAVLDVLPFSKKRNKDNHRFEPHLCGIYIGYANFVNEFLSFNPSRRASLNAAQAGAGNLGVYMRYSTLELFEKNKGPELYPFSFGLNWHW